MIVSKLVTIRVRHWRFVWARMLNGLLCQEVDQHCECDCACQPLPLTTLTKQCVSKRVFVS